MGTDMLRTRLDKLVVKHGLAPTRGKAQALIMAGQIAVNGEAATKAGASIAEDAQIEMIGEPPKYVGRGGIKLEGALSDFSIDPNGKVCLDLGASTGGFTDCLLQHGARKVIAVDVGKGQLEWKLRQDARVVVVEGRNARHLTLEDTGELAEIVTADLAFISVTKVLPAALTCSAPGATFLILVKPQFELRREQVGRGGIVRKDALHEEAVENVRRATLELGMEVVGVRPSHLTGAEGNREFFLVARKPAGL